VRRYLIIHCIKSLEDMFVAQAALIAKEDDMTLENRWNAYTKGRGRFYRKPDQQQLMRCFVAIDNYQLVLEHTDKSYGVVSGEFDNVVSADTTHWPGVVAPTTGVAPTIDSSGSDDDGVAHAISLSPIDDDDEADSDFSFEADAEDDDDDYDGDTDDGPVTQH
jgi:hypothetical protein